MAKTMTRVIPVENSTDKINAYATIMRSMISASTAALRLGDKGLAEMFTSFKDQANMKYNELLSSNL